ncbi:Beta-amyloid-like protein [Melipona quadrifasciata]|uniref:Beta-amyloid-like protein n=1 Tax=Melipona quadrifasciata TaxID=166423 RepID=A0A0N0BKN7_9HYME|nr:Beta-amyloid-like protein [Melipona quadrifasciata]
MQKYIKHPQRQYDATEVRVIIMLWGLETKMFRLNFLNCIYKYIAYIEDNEEGVGDKNTVENAVSERLELAPAGGRSEPQVVCSITNPIVRVNPEFLIVATLCEAGEVYLAQHMGEQGRWVSSADKKSCMTDKLEILEYCKKLKLGCIWFIADRKLGFPCLKAFFFLVLNMFWEFTAKSIIEARGDSEELSTICIIAYPKRDITNIVESSHYVRVSGWCKPGRTKCKLSRWVKPYRCLAPDMVSKCSARDRSRATRCSCRKVACSITFTIRRNAGNRTGRYKCSGANVFRRRREPVIDLQVVLATA